MIPTTTVSTTIDLFYRATTFVHSNSEPFPFRVACLFQLGFILPQAFPAFLSFLLFLLVRTHVLEHLLAHYWLFLLPV